MQRNPWQQKKSNPVKWKGKWTLDDSERPTKIIGVSDKSLKILDANKAMKALESRGKLDGKKTTNNTITEIKALDTRNKQMPVNF